MSNSSQLPPPSGNPNQAEYYMTKLVELIDMDKLTAARTDLSKFNPTALHDHFRLDLKDYEVEISHNKQPDSGKDFYVILFNNLKFINEQCSEKVILAYMHLSPQQFHSFKSATERQMLRKKRLEEEKRLQEAMAPIDHTLDQLATSSSHSTQSPPIFAES